MRQYPRDDLILRQITVQLKVLYLPCGTWPALELHLVETLEMGIKEAVICWVPWTLCVTFTVLFSLLTFQLLFTRNSEVGSISSIL